MADALAWRLPVPMVVSQIQRPPVAFLLAISSYGTRLPTTKAEISTAIFWFVALMNKAVDSSKTLNHIALLR